METTERSLEVIVALLLTYLLGVYFDAELNILNWESPAKVLHLGASTVMFCLIRVMRI